MGDPKRKRKKYNRPKKMWDKKDVEERRETAELYGLKNKKEIWKTETFLRKKRQNARKLLALPIEKRTMREKELLNSLVELGALGKTASLDNVLSLKTEALLERRFSSIVWRKGLTQTPKQARQLITHGHIGVKGKKVTVPGYLIKKNEETSVGFLDKALERKLRETREKKAEDKKAPQETIKAPEPKKTAEKKEAAAEETKEKVKEETAEKSKEEKPAEKTEPAKKEKSAKKEKEEVKEEKKEKTEKKPEEQKETKKGKKAEEKKEGDEK